MHAVRCEGTEICRQAEEQRQNKDKSRLRAKRQEGISGKAIWDGVKETERKGNRKICMQRGMQTCMQTGMGT